MPRPGAAATAALASAHPAHGPSTADERHAPLTCLAAASKALAAVPAAAAAVFRVSSSLRSLVGHGEPLPVEPAARAISGTWWDAALRVAFLVLRAMRLGSTGRQQSHYSLHKLVWRTWMERSRLRCMSLAYFLAGWAIC